MLDLSSANLLLLLVEETDVLSWLGAVDGLGALVGLGEGVESWEIVVVVATSA
jgi:hypothetical protein